MGEASLRSVCCLSKMAISIGPRFQVPWIKLVGAIAILALSIVTGTVIVLDIPRLTIAVISIPFLLLVVSLPRTLIWVTIVGGVVVSGLSDLYFPQVGPLRWIASAAGFLLLLISTAALVFARRDAANDIDRLRPDRSILSWPFLFVVLLIYSGIFYNNLDQVTLIAGVKGYVQYLGLMVTFVAIRLTRKQADRFYHSIIVLALIQVPFALHQFLVLVPQRVTTAAAQDLVVAVDIVVGTFTGSETGGGANAVLSLLQMSAVALLASRWKVGLIAGRHALFVSLLCLVPLFLNEAKVTFIFLMIVVAVVFRDQIVKVSARALMIAILLGAVLVAMFFAYNQLLPKAQKEQTAAEYIEKIMETNFGSLGYGRYRQNRLGSVIHWSDENLRTDRFGAMLLGYGPGSARSSGLGGIAPLQLRYWGEGVDLTGFSVLLWEAGVLGLTTVLGLLGHAFSLARRLSIEGPDAQARASGLALQASMLMFLVSLFHNNFIAFEVGFQTIMMLMIGYLACVAPANGRSRELGGAV